MTTCLVEVALCMYRGDTLPVNFIFTDPQGAPIDISNTTLWMTVKADPEDEDVDAAFQTSVTFPQDANSAAGIGYIEIDAASSALFVPGQNYYYDFQWIDINSKVFTVGAGTLEIRRDITRAVA